ncbi:hypothetical protein [Priestia aryabhattai]
MIHVAPIPLSKITPLYYEKLNHKKLKQFTKLVKDGITLDKLIQVEYDEEQDEYWLINGLYEYEAYKSVGVKELICHVLPLSKKANQKIAFLRNTIFSKNNSWLIKYINIQQLIQEGKSTKFIAKEIGVEESEILHFTVHPNVPQNIIEAAYNNDRSLPLLNEIQKLPLSNGIKRKFYERAVLPKRNPENITYDNLEKIKVILKSPLFSLLLNDEDKWQMIEQGIRYKPFLQSYWNSKMRSKIFGNMYSQEANDNFTDGQNLN